MQDVYFATVMVKDQYCKPSYYNKDSVASGFVQPLCAQVILTPENVRTQKFSEIHSWFFAIHL